MRNFISVIHSDLRAARKTKRGATLRPEDAPRGGGKEYPRMPRIALPASIPDMRLADAIEQRRSSPANALPQPMTLDTIGALLAGIRARQGGLARGYPSGGGLYPIETYFIGKVAKEAPRVFHYHPKTHALEQLWQVPENTPIASLFHLLPEQSNVAISGAILFTAVWARSSKKYGDFAYTLGMLEAGHMAQNVLLVAAALGMPARPMGGFSDEAVHALLDIDGESEQALYAIMLA